MGISSASSRAVLNKRYVVASGTVAALALSYLTILRMMSKWSLETAVGSSAVVFPSLQASPSRWREDSRPWNNPS